MKDVCISEIFVIIQDARKYVHVGLRDCVPAIEAIHNVECSLHTHYSLHLLVVSIASLQHNGADNTNFKQGVEESGGKSVWGMDTEAKPTGMYSRRLL